MSGVSPNGEEIDEHLKKFLEQHANQLQASGVPSIYWQSLFVKLKEDIYDAGESFKMLCYEMESDDEETDETKDVGDDGEEEIPNYKWMIEATKDVQKDDSNSIFLIDHAWSYRLEEARQHLQTIPGLLQRMASLMAVSVNGRSNPQIEDDILTEMWKFNQTYSFGNFERGDKNAMPVWYVMDEFGSRIQHSESSNCRTVPFFWTTTKMAYTLMWLTEDVENGDEITRDYIENEEDGDIKKARLLAWEPCDMKAVSYKQEEPEMEYFVKYSMTGTSPNFDKPFPGLPKDRNVRIFVEYSSLKDHLTDKRFEIVETEEEADVIWTFKSWKDFKKLSEEMPGKMINQFPSESVMTVKDLLAVVCRRVSKEEEDPDTLERNPDWLPITYNLKTELHKFASYFQHREEKGLDNHWICKPWNLARGLDMHITNNINYITRLPDSGPKVACKYVEDPVLFFREEVGNVKFDIRYVVLLSSVKPLKLFVYRVFWLRFANKPFSMDHFDEYEKHFTVMNYVEGGINLKQIHYDDFIPMFEAQYPAFAWDGVEESIFQMLREMFEGATALPAPQGIGHNPQSRAMYAVDLLLRWSTDKNGVKVIRPVLCEVNFMPDCDRAVKYHPFFSNDVFSTLFLDDPESKYVTQLL
ncbi:tubulin--tyrosine ligase-like protein 12 [Mizuhopecten yessoensis]|uniref:Tubulin--tyrosine ligase-like protein 12 n=1 Tax=Mizuhopecten yessoensis TaxID=6573 RepID=A0A210QEJ4_MIZYE|nr:tubulin--tyrosine ligase-like protein 12 [Mizuhopecten yessoensis]OWF47118.1 Tubulin--tyrosine ligase-like protein 12 [Mizuhopecten yessoensis]